MKYSSTKNWFRSAGQPGLVVLAICLNLAAQAQPLQLATVVNSAKGPADSGSGDSLGPVISPDGRYVLFASTANNLVAINATNPLPAVNPPPLNVFLRDRTNRATVLVSVNLAGTGGGNDDSWPIAVSTNGQYVLFESAASNLVADDTNLATDVFVRDLMNGITLLVSVATDGGVGNGASGGSAMTPDGRYVVFQSAASNLVPGDTNSIPDVFVRDLQSGLTTLVSVGAQSASRLSLKLITAINAPDITPDGRYVVFRSLGTNLVPGVASANEVYVRDLSGQTTVWASSGAIAAVQAVFGWTNASSFNYAISADGQFVAYEASPSSALPGVILRYGLLSSATDVVHTNAAVGPLADRRHLDMTPDGRFLAFLATTNGYPGTNSCILVWDAQSDRTTLASGNLTNGLPANSVCDWPVLDATGRFVAFLSSGISLVTNALAGDFHLYVRDLQAGVTTLVNADANGVGALLNSAPIPSLSADGRYVAFECPAGTLAPNDGSRGFDVFVRDLAAGTTELISERVAALPSLAPNGPCMVFPSTVSSDGRFVAFASEADNLVSNDTNGCRDVFVRDLLLGTNLLASASTNNAAPGDNLSTDPALSGDGRYVAFTSSADNLVPGDTNRAQDVFVRDLQVGSIVLVSGNSSGTGPGNSDSYSPAISATGRYVLFRSLATNLVLGIFTGGENVFVRDLQSGTTTPMTQGGRAGTAAMTPDGHYIAFVDVLSGTVATNLYVWDNQAAARIYTNTATGIAAVAISPDGRRVLYWNSVGLYAADLVANTKRLITVSPANRVAIRPGLRFSADGRYLTYAASANAVTTNQVYLFDFQTGATLLVSESAASGGPANGSSDSPDISADGRLVAYRSAATDIPTQADTNGVPNIFVFDQQTGVTTLLNASRFGSRSADNRSRAPVFSGNGQTLVFESWASDLVDRTFSFNGDIFAVNLFTSSPIVLFSAAIVPGAQGPWIVWPALPGKTYHVQFKNSLSDPQWQDANGNVIVVSGTGYLKDLVPAPTQRFYRILAY